MHETQLEGIESSNSFEFSDIEHVPLARKFLLISEEGHPHLTLKLTQQY